MNPLEYFDFKDLCGFVEFWRKRSKFRTAMQSLSTLSKNK